MTVNTMIAMFGLSGGELLVVLAIVLILFGAKKIPDFAKGLGQGIKEFRKASREVQDELERATDELNAPVVSSTSPKPAQDVIPQDSESEDEAVMAADSADETDVKSKDTPA